MNKGIYYAIGAYGLWGLLTIFWKSIQSVPAHEILCHRMVWSLIFLVGIIVWKGHWKWIKYAVQNRKTLLTFLGTSCIIAVNWYTFVWAVNSGFIVETSLGYFINPLINVLLGVIFLREKLRLWQLVAISIATIGVLYLTFNYGSFPWIGITLALTFGFYGLLRKTAALNSIEGLSFEMAVLFFPALLYLIYLENSGAATFGHAEIQINGLLLLTGVATATPLLLFVNAAKKITLTNLGLIQYLAPSLSFLLGVFVYGEALTKVRFIGFTIIWIALIIYTCDTVLYARKMYRLRQETT